MKFAVLSSGSKANSLVLSTASTAVLLDCGLSCRKTEERLNAVGLDPRNVQAIVVSHEHSDHVNGVRVFVKKYAVPVYVSESMAHSNALAAIGENIDYRYFRSGKSFEVGDLKFSPFSISHDAVDPVAFRVAGEGCEVAVVTDLGQVSELVRFHMRDVDALVLEFNHDRTRLMNSVYPWEVKQRIASRTGHLNNDIAADAMVEVAISSSRLLQIVVAAHVSENSNCPHLVRETMQTSWSRAGLAYTPQFLVASVDRPLPLIDLNLSKNNFAVYANEYAVNE